jgi:dTDP-4-dehydrorhamnose 3,5-epimerase-like enzyme
MRLLMEVKLIPLQLHGDARGGLIALEEGKNVPFEMKRVYYLIETKSDVRRGFHAHKALRQIAIAVRGSCTFLLDDGCSSQEVKLENPSQGLLIEGLIWREMFNFSEDCVLMVLADALYDETDYIRNYDEFLKFTTLKKV